ncbi:MAG TPA: crossover junction endodeoxyribonuclease RuvC [Spirochaetota bacterium]|nr:crossover junction endodeoxyribonuclease RuvC [Spirochaetota bacterium]OPZ39215.1 MAG: Crossover junction endodeoxyribonuclease RuvC [Spirochaetes bacterium ADurb.BinA120]HNU91527.1 crossover junction endodeoxyribonuclease RuvC [Spirochaetota bacterium]HPI13844.1 crossover junction endodeoxyribonuclease RuvC [Spirochaetota bacterium]HPV96980.1 crossover junction endodeoxyribonuclease RuvC [Spirochaetota bacterium]
MRILGIDPGFGKLGWAVIDDGFKLAGCGAIVTGPGGDFQERLLAIYREIEAILDRFAPAVLAMERLYFSKNATTAMDVGKCIGVVLLCAAKKGLPCAEYTPLQVKRSLTGCGKSTKRQMQIMTGKLYGMKKPPSPDDAADALAVATCHYLASSSAAAAAIGGMGPR